MLDKVGLTEDLISTGRKVAETMVELFADPDGDGFFYAGSDAEALIARHLPGLRAVIRLRAGPAIVRRRPLGDGRRRAPRGVVSARREPRSGKACACQMFIRLLTHRMP